MHYLLLAITTLFLLPQLSPVYAVTTTIIESPSQIGDESFKVTVQVEGASAGTNYLRVDLYQEGTKNYFGETDNTQVWYGGSDGKQYYPITINSGQPTIATVSARLGEPTQSDYPGPGAYKLRVRRYTSSGNQGSEDPPSRDIIITKAWPSPSPSPSPTPTPTPTPTPIPTPSQTSTPTPQPAQTGLPVQGGSPSTRPTPSPSLSESPVGTVAGEMSEINLAGYGMTGPLFSPSASPSSNALRLNSSRAQSVLIIAIGLITLSLASYLGYKRYQKSQIKSV